jgi:hypothetical protein
MLKTRSGQSAASNVRDARERGTRKQPLYMHLSGGGPCKRKSIPLRIGVGGSAGIVRLPPTVTGAAEFGKYW